MLKNPTPRQIALLSSAWILAGVLVVFAVFRWLGTSLPPILDLGILAIGTFLVAYYVILSYLKKYIYRKIKLIYKTIHKEKLKPGQKNKSVDIESDIIGEVDKEVAEWAESQRKELDKYKNWAEYRRNFVGDISHELKTPIFNIQGYIEPGSI